MKATGIVRRLDDLGRVVLPVEFRRIYGWDGNTDVEIFVTDDGALILRKYSLLDNGSFKRLISDVGRMQEEVTDLEANRHLKQACSHLKVAQSLAQPECKKGGFGA